MKTAIILTLFFSDNISYKFYDSQDQLKYAIETPDHLLRLENILFSKGLNFFKIIYHDKVVSVGKFIVN